MSEQCRNCGAPLAGAYCSQCGQQAAAGVKPAGRWFADVFTDLAEFDHRIFPTIRDLLTRPGSLTYRYRRGQVVSQTPPFKLYLILSAISIAVMSAIGVFDVDSMLAGADPQDLETIGEIFGVEDPFDPLFQERFNRRMNTLFPVFNLITPFALCLALKLLFWRRLLHEHLVFALHYSSAMVTYGTLVLPLVAVFGNQTLLVAAVAGLVMVGMFAYMARALFINYSVRGWSLIARLVLLYAGLVVIAQAISAMTFWLVLKTV